MIVALCGGIGGAKLALGLARTLPPEDLTVIANTGDDFEHLGLAISPDIDTLTYTLAGLDDPERGWGRRDESWQFMAALTELGGASWFRLGDRDLALHVERTRRLRDGQTLSAVTASLSRRLGVGCRLLPMSDDPVRTEVAIGSARSASADPSTVPAAGAADGPTWISFQDYFVRRQCVPPVADIRYAGAADARPAPGVLEALSDASLRAILILPSNPWLSIDPILAVPGIRAAIANATVPVIAVSPLVGGQAIKGPTAKLMDELGIARDVAAIGEHYADCIDVLVVDRVDADAPSPVRTEAADTVMRSLDDRMSLARTVVAIADREGRRTA